MPVSVNVLGHVYGLKNTLSIESQKNTLLKKEPVHISITQLKTNIIRTLSNM